MKTHRKIPLKSPADGKILMHYTACGLIGRPAHMGAFDPRDVDCINCRSTELMRKKLYGDKKEEKR